MKQIYAAVFVLAALLSFTTPVMAGDFDFLMDLNVRAQSDIPAYKSHLSAFFGVSTSNVDFVMSAVSSPGDAYMALRLSNLSHKPVEVVVEEYRKNKGQGWGVIAKNMGIKPGSKEFHALKEKDKYEGGKGKGKGKGGGQGKGKGHK